MNINNKKLEELKGTFIRDITSIKYMSKSEARSRLNEILKEQQAEFVKELRQIMLIKNKAPFIGELIKKYENNK